MRQSVFVERRRDGWVRLEALLDMAERRGLRALAPEQIEELGRLYRWVTSDLAFATGRGYDQNLQAYLHRLTARSHSYVYAGNVEGGWTRIARFFAHDFPCEVRNSRWFILACAGLFAVAAVAAYALIRAVPTDAYSILPDQLVRPIHEKIHDTNFGFDRDLSSLVSAEIMTNNIQVAFKAFGAGIIPFPLPGTLTAYLVFYNGLIVGGEGAMYTNAGFGYDFWATIAPHGVIELTAIQIAAAAGLLLAAAILNPGRLRVVDALKRNSRRALVLILGVCGMLVCAALIEGFVSPQRVSPELRLAVGAMTALCLIVYFGFVGRDEPVQSALDAAQKRGTANG
ncbi:MAG: stage II sporulation protein M [Candidatus Eremiobacteraeota bacterium]|nr:stage II sporulation protein M [Candidatus Eremiobacteraeota bacterium]MBV8222499.1 stage II sporulation protein M [Candidatus Eremiobacteraeota bacterium]